VFGNAADKRIAIEELMLALSLIRKDKVLRVTPSDKDTSVTVKSLLGIFPAACGVIWRDEQIYT